MATDTRIQLPPANYKVEQMDMGRKHVYRVTRDNGEVSNYGGVTGVLGVIAKPQLIPWANNQGISHVVASLICGDDLKATAERARDVAEGIKAAKKSKKFVEYMTKFLAEKFTWEKGTKIDVSPPNVAEIMNRAIKAPDEIKDEAASIGTMAHAYFEKFIRGEDPGEISDKIRPAVDAFNKWISEAKLSIVGGDTKVASIKHCYGGALDFLAIDNNENWVLGDFKTSSGCWPEYCLQVAAYLNAFSETYGIECTRAIIVRFSKTEPVEFEVKELKDIKKSFEAFLAAKELQGILRDELFL